MVKCNIYNRMSPVLPEISENLTPPLTYDFQAKTNTMT